MKKLNGGRQRHRIGVVGTGYVGLTLAVVFAQEGFEVVGVDTNRSVIDGINRLEPQFHEAGLISALRRHLHNGLTIAEELPDEPMDTYVVCVGTPWDRERQRPVADYVERAVHEVARVFAPDSLVVVRSTVPLGTSRNVVLPILQRKSDRVLLAYCPERTAEGVALKELRELPQIIGALDEEATARAHELFRRITPTIAEVSSLEAAEAIKLINNSYRDIVFAFANEVGYLAEAFALDAWELIRSANLGYPRSAIPSPGYVGGACLSKDPYILTYSAQLKGFTPSLVGLARQTNETLPAHTVEKLTKRLDSLGKRISGAKVLIAGLAFKGIPETDDVRESPALTISQMLQSMGARVYGHDFVVPESAIARNEIVPCTLEEGFTEADAALFLNNHEDYPRVDFPDLASLMSHPAVIFDAWRLFDPKLLAGLDGVECEGLGRV